ncbi:hypothetical protein [Microvirga guangxiensis]|uniref:Uncharacterized protein n=1 Tax=Microvirga guangxiensis TaxID=549386 RepID=A0A1G5KME6_9HYPH|nr:hypothetical protein [Microvirga guangxiensis]SCZ01268.1 hypothetical protein SAMN02927923_03421 [Microvirga guangxiensis]
MALTNTERQRIYREKLKAGATRTEALEAENAALKQQLEQSRRVIDELRTANHQAVVPKFDIPEGTAAVICLSAHEVHRLNRMKKCRQFLPDGRRPLAFDTYRVLGLNISGWERMPLEFLAKFGLLDAARIWKKQEASALRRINITEFGFDPWES